MLLTLGTLAIVAVIIVLWRHQLKERSQASRTAAPDADETAHHAVYIKFNKKNCCAAVRELSVNKFLSAEAPSLPLDGCDRPGRCRCVYAHLADRRSKRGRRTTDHGYGDPIYFGPERRSGEDRRHEADEEADDAAPEEPRDYFLR